MLTKRDLNTIIECLQLQLTREQILMEEKAKTTTINKGEMDAYNERRGAIEKLIEKVRTARGVLTLGGAIGSAIGRHRNPTAS
jgi:hypothetical protein